MRAIAFGERGDGVEAQTTKDEEEEEKKNRKNPRTKPNRPSLTPTEMRESAFVENGQPTLF
jgi:hypothetical protein